MYNVVAHHSMISFTQQEKGAFPKKGSLSILLVAKSNNFILTFFKPNLFCVGVQNLFCVGVQNLFCVGVQNLFCVDMECKIYFALRWSAKFILPCFFQTKFILR
ncbi:MAG: hypothetical protein DRR16_25460 [Candidatus Parabeggiatoa sp. nov. 3]|nr:MAG: hypothetical protein DRR00_20475 [Gammaproteobacteria bacterium]RKZ79568.1 MAG: hypothetical protein DRR16_25460 [Gammaproteobacteria bacterium]